MKKITLLYVCLAMSSFAGEIPRRHHRLWNWSIVALAGANAADVATSIGRHELNPVFAGSNGNLNTGRAIEVKCAMTGALVFSQWLFTRKHPEMVKPFTVVNFATAATFGGIAAHNLSVPKSTAISH